jgi:hypothetical protein
MPVNLKIDVVGANDPMPSVSKKFVTNPVASDPAESGAPKPFRKIDRAQTAAYESAKIARVTNVASRA